MEFGGDNERDPEPIRLARSVYEGLPEEEIDEIEQIALDRSRFFRDDAPRDGVAARQAWRSNSPDAAR